MSELKDPCTSQSCVPHVVALSLTNFRNLECVQLEFDRQLVVLTGANGAGKTNLLEALSLLSPGRGLRRVAAQEMNGPVSEGFALHAKVQNGEDLTGIGVGWGGFTRTTGSSSREVRIDGQIAKRSDDLLDLVRIMWLTPAMDRLFTGSAGDRRRFVDRMVLAIDSQHGRRTNAFDRAVRSRNKLLADLRSEAGWLDGIELQIAEHGVAIAAARQELISLLQHKINDDPEGPFPKADVALDGLLEGWLQQMSASDVEAAFVERLKTNRSLDAASGRTGEGPHRSDLLVHYRDKNMPAGLCSTGEQKALLTGLVLAHAGLVSDLTRMRPLLLLDEIGAHLDAERRASLFDILEVLGGQVFMTGTDEDLFCSIRTRAQMITVNDGQCL